jgi:hypothetical protein
VRERWRRQERVDVADKGWKGRRGWKDPRAGTDRMARGQQSREPDREKKLSDRT